MLLAVPFKEQDKADKMVVNASTSHEPVEDCKHDVAFGEPVEVWLMHYARCSDHPTNLV